MRNSKVIVNLTDLTKTSGLRLLAGRDNGEEAKIHFNLSEGEYSLENTLVIIDEGEVVVSNSYFLGMLEDLFHKYETKVELIKHIEFNQLSITNQKELLRGINRAYSKAINAMSH